MDVYAQAQNNGGDVKDPAGDTSLCFPCHCRSTCSNPSHNTLPTLVVLYLPFLPPFAACSPFILFHAVLPIMLCCCSHSHHRHNCTSFWWDVNYIMLWTQNGYQVSFSVMNFVTWLSGWIGWHSYGHWLYIVMYISLVILTSRFDQTRFQCVVNYQFSWSFELMAKWRTAELLKFPDLRLFALGGVQCPQFSLWFDDASHICHIGFQY